MSAHDSTPAADIPEMPAPRVRETAAHSIGGALALLLGLLGLLAAVALFVAASVNPGFAVGGVVVLVAAVICCAGSTPWRRVRPGSCSSSAVTAGRSARTACAG